MPRCSSCSAPLPAKSIICSYCNMRNDIDLCKPAKKVEISFASDRICPDCRELMQRQNYKKHSGVIIDVCETDGIWLDAGELKQLLEWIELGGHNKNRTRKEITDKMILTQKKEEKRADLNHKAQEGDKERSSKKRALGPDPYTSILSDFFSF